MLQLAFSSTMATSMEGACIDALVEDCRSHNLESGITGSMIVGGNRFTEILEGDEAVVTNTFGRICRDQRHHAIVLLGRRRTDRRLYPETPLGFRQIAPLGVAMSLAQMAIMLRDDVLHKPIYQPLKRYASILAAA